jgi:hypothetical protein
VGTSIQVAPSFPGEGQQKPSVAVTPYDANGNWVGIGNGVVLPVTMTDLDYYQAQPLAVQKAIMLQMPVGPDRTAMFAALAAQGFLIDEAIMVLAQSPTELMAERLQDGYTYVPSMLQLMVSIAPGLAAPGYTAYVPKPPFPPGSIVVSVKASDYPAMAVPVAPPPPPVPYVGSYMGNGYWGASEAAQSLFEAGQTTVQGGVKYAFFVGTDGPFGKTYFWTLASPSA